MTKTISLVSLLILLAGCASSPRDDRYISYGQIHGESVRVPPCNPFYADQLMSWATELDGEYYHKRKARATVDSSGWVRCGTKEVAGSVSRGR